MGSKDVKWPDRLEDWIGFRVSEVSEYTVEAGQILNWLDAMRDGNPIYWDEEVAAEISGGIVAPPPMTLTFSMTPRWSPRRPDEVWDVHGTERGETPLRMPMEAHFAFKEFTGLREGIVSAIESEFYAPLRLGDRLTVSSSVTEVGEMRTNKLGTGRNWTVEGRFENQRGKLVSIERYRFYCYNREASA